MSDAQTPAAATALPDLVEYCGGRGLQVLLRREPLNGYWLASARDAESLEPRGSSCHAVLADACQALGTTVDGELSLDDADLSQPTAWLFGPEAHGLPVDLAAKATHRVHIPMPGNAESLNVASAAAICLYQSAKAQPGK